MEITHPVSKHQCIGALYSHRGGVHMEFGDAAGRERDPAKVSDPPQRTIPGASGANVAVRWSDHAPT
jgi:hypothetical protein